MRTASSVPGFTSGNVDEAIHAASSLNDQAFNRADGSGPGAIMQAVYSAQSMGGGHDRHMNNMKENQPRNIVAAYDGDVHRHTLTGPPRENLNEKGVNAHHRILYSATLTGAINYAQDEHGYALFKHIYMRNKRILSEFELQVCMAFGEDPEHHDMELLIGSVLEDNGMSPELLQEADVEDLVYNWRVQWERMGSPPLTYDAVSDLITDDFLDIESEHNSD